MTREEARKKAEIMLAYANGKEIEFYNDEYKTWASIDDPSFDYHIDCYRIKRELKYRPFKDQKECVEEMKKHEPFGWLKSIKHKYHISCTHFFNLSILLANGSLYRFSRVFENFTFADGTPFGIKEE